jgi:rfaE bifunctional protein kinase chain/domain
MTSIMDNFKNTSIAVIGDICLDLYYFITEKKSEISVETGLQTQSVSSIKHEAGGAGNVAINLNTLGASQVDLYGVVGHDPFGVTIKSILAEAGINCSYIQTQRKDWNTHVYHKIYKLDHEDPRFDIGNFNVVSPESVNPLLKDIESNIDKYQVVIINEQILSGYHNQTFQSGLNKLIKKYENNCIWITDSRHLNNVYNNTIRKLNNHEALALYRKTGENKSDNPDIKMLAQWLNSYWKKPLIITRGEEGVVAVDHSGQLIEIPGINLIGRKDTVGAGDAFLSACALTLATGNNLEKAVTLGNFSAAVSVTKIFETGHPSKEEVLKMGTSTDYRYHSDLASDMRNARYLIDQSGEESLVELIDIKKTGIPKVVIFDHDGTISTLRQGWEPIMKEVVIDSILGEFRNSLSLEDFKKIEADADAMIEKTTGIQTIIQMFHLREMVRSYGYVSEDKILTAPEYKQIYNEKLLEMVSKRVNLFRKGLLKLEDLTIKDVISFLDKLKKQGVRIYLASGTDQDDVRREAEVLGYADYFNGGIFGSVGNVDRDPKRLVIETIVKDLPEGIKMEECYVFGDGPVEMREAAKLGFTRIGVMSDERQRFGINPEKRPRLILGGAQALIPDFSWMPSLIEYLEWEI